MSRICGERDIDARLDVFLSSEKGAFSRNAVQKFVEKGLVFVNGKPAKSNYRLKEGDVVEFSPPPPVELDAKPQDIPLEIVYEDDALIVVDKPKGLVVHPAAGHKDGTLVNGLLFSCGGLSGINGVTRPGIVHRIDKDTSGLLVVAKTDAVHMDLCAQFAEHSVKRAYKAIARGSFKEDEGVIDAPIGRCPRDRKKMAVNFKNGKRAVTRYVVLERLGRRFTYIEARLETGRTHQIRVHMAHVGRPLLGDNVYGSGRQDICGQTLHAGVLGFTHPVTGKRMEFESDLPKYFTNILKRLRAN
ncbi:MAG: RluA family pseudouridine synthase [Clostridiales bacterium]|jgi:23S rRNA pseudouridine1911/1915/1917 synthase|nr:RluA family pseudouridine synthase [Clostridiales bacterium]